MQHYLTSGVPLLTWLSLLLAAACAPPQETTLFQLTPSASFSGREANLPGPLSDICFDSHSNLYTLNLDSGCIGKFSPQGRAIPVFACLPEAGGDRHEEAVSLGYAGRRVLVVRAAENALDCWSESGAFVASMPLQVPLSPGHTVVTGAGEVLHADEAVPGEMTVWRFSHRGALIETMTASGPAAGKLSQNLSLRDSLARGEIPATLQNSALLAEGIGERVYLLYRSRPVLQCYEHGALLFEIFLDFPELPGIAEAVRVRNRLLKVPRTYIPFSYWSDFVIDESGRLFILVALQTHHTIYQLDPDGRVQRKFLGVYGKGHLLAASAGRLAVADAIHGKVSIYTLPAPPD